MSVTPILLCGTDLDVANGARASLAVEHTTLTSADEGLIRRLVTDQHSEPLRGVWAKFRFVCSIGCARQVMTHKRYLAINERSTRYSVFNEQFVYPPLKEQIGKAMEYRYQPLSDDERDIANKTVHDSYMTSYRAYESLLGMGVAREDARSVLPLGLETALIASGDLVAWLRFLARRTDPHAQDEIRTIARAVEMHLSTIVPVTLAAWTTSGRRAL